MGDVKRTKRPMVGEASLSGCRNHGSVYNHINIVIVIVIAIVIVIVIVDTSTAQWGVTHQHLDSERIMSTTLECSISFNSSIIFNGSINF